MSQTAAAQALDSRSWLSDQLGHTPSSGEFDLFERMIGTLRTSREALVKATDPAIVRAAWRWETAHKQRDSITFQLRARLNALGAAVEVETPARAPRRRREEKVVRPDFIEGTISRPRDARAQVTVGLEEGRRLLGLSTETLRALGVRQIVVEVE